ALTTSMRTPSSALSPYTTLFRSVEHGGMQEHHGGAVTRELGGKLRAARMDPDGARRHACFSCQTIRGDFFRFAAARRAAANAAQIGRAHVRTPVTFRSRIPSSD